MPKIKPELVSLICDEYRKGSTLKEIAFKIGVSPPTVSKCIKDNNVPLRSKGRKKKQKVHENYADVMEKMEGR